MGILGMLLEITKPAGMWESMVFGLENGILNYGLTLFVLTIIIKIALTPIDFVNRLTSKKMGLVQAKINEQDNALKEKYAKNPKLYETKKNELYQREQKKMMGSCFGMLIPMILQMVIFFTLLSGLNNIAAYKIQTQYETLKTTYYEVVSVEDIDNTYNSIAGDDIIAGKTEEEIKELVEKANAAVAELVKPAEDAVVKKYDEIKESFLWIKNIWRPDTVTSIIPSFKDYSTIAKLSTKDMSKEEAEIYLKNTQAEYERIMNPVARANSGSNGYYILTILSAVITFLSMQITTWIERAKAKKRGILAPANTNKLMVWLMPIIMAIFTLFYNTAFAIYIVTSSLITLIINPLISLIIDKIDVNKENKEKEKNKVSYSRY